MDNLTEKTKDDPDEKIIGELQNAETELAEALARESQIIVNGRERTIKGREVSFEQAVKLAFPSGPSRPDVKYTVTYRNAAKPPHIGELDAGQSVTVKPGRNPKQETVFNVTETVLS